MYLGVPWEAAMRATVAGMAASHKAASHKASSYKLLSQAGQGSGIATTSAIAGSTLS